MPKKYIFENGVMKINPEYKSSTQTNPQAIPVVSSTNDIAEASEAQVVALGQGIALPESTIQSMDIVQDSEYLANIHAPENSEILDKLTEAFSILETPVGLLNKLLALQMFHLRFILDDSGSMREPSDVTLKDATIYTLAGREASPDLRLTRWEEVQDRLHLMIDMLAYIPVQSIKMIFLNRRDSIILRRDGRDPEAFKAYAHALITTSFSTGPSGLTPIFKALQTAFVETLEPTMHYLITDGVPSDGNVEDICTLINSRKAPRDNPLTLISCTNRDRDVVWMKSIEERATMVSEVDDFKSETKEVEHDQGPGFPYTRGFWLLCQLVAAINPDDLDAMDENLPFTRNTLSNLMGYELTPALYQQYFERNPNAILYIDKYVQFLNEPGFARHIISKSEQNSREMRAGYTNGERPHQTSQSLEQNMRRVSAQITEHTQRAMSSSGMGGSVDSKASVATSSSVFFQTERAAAGVSANSHAAGEMKYTG